MGRRQGLASSPLSMPHQQAVYSQRESGNQSCDLRKSFSLSACTGMCAYLSVNHHRSQEGSAARNHGQGPGERFRQYQLQKSSHLQIFSLKLTVNWGSSILIQEDMQEKIYKICCFSLRLYSKNEDEKAKLVQGYKLHSYHVYFESLGVL